MYRQGGFIYNGRSPIWTDAAVAAALDGSPGLCVARDICALALTAIGLGPALVLGFAQGAVAEQNPLTAIDIALEPDATMLQHAKDANARLLKSLHRAPGRSGHRAVRRQRRRQLRQCARRDDQRPLQGRGDPSARTLALVRSRRVRHPGMGRLVQPSPAAGAHRQYSAGRSRRTLLRYAANSQPWQRDSNQIASGKPGAVHPEGL